MDNVMPNRAKRRVSLSISKRNVGFELKEVRFRHTLEKKEVWYQTNAVNTDNVRDGIWHCLHGWRDATAPILDEPQELAIEYVGRASKT
jgi:hypothetical protein